MAAGYINPERIADRQDRSAMPMKDQQATAVFRQAAHEDAAGLVGWNMEINLARLIPVEPVREWRLGVRVRRKLDRLARSVSHLVSIGERLDAKGVSLKVLEQAIDTSTPTGRLMFNMLGASLSSSAS